MPSHSYANAVSEVASDSVVCGTSACRGIHILPSRQRAPGHPRRSMPLCLQAQGHHSKGWWQTEP